MQRVESLAQLLAGPLQALVLPRLRLADVQSLGQTCAAVRDVTQGLPDALLTQLAEVPAGSAAPAYSLRQCLACAAGPPSDAGLPRLLKPVGSSTAASAG